MKSGTILFPNSYLADPRVKLFDNSIYNANKNRFVFHKDISWQDVEAGSKIDDIEGDFVILFGTKTLVRRLRKKRYSKEVIMSKVKSFFDKNIPRNMPVGVIEDFDLINERIFGDYFRDLFLNHFNGKFFLLREFSSEKKYPSGVHPFSICCGDHTHLMKSSREKTVDLYFRGDNSGKKKMRSRIIGDLDKSRPNYKKDVILYEGGESSKEKMPYEDFLNKLSLSKVCLTIEGNGWDCFRYQEIPSVGGILASPVTPHVINNDYKDMDSCIKFSSINDLNDKMGKIISSDSMLEGMQNKAVENFKKFHTSEARFSQLLEYVDLLK